MKSQSRARIARHVLPRYSRSLDLANGYALARAWTREHSNAPRFKSRSELFAHVAENEFPESPVDFMEFGVAAGRSIRLWMDLKPETESRFFGFDSFHGLPEDWSPEHRVGSFSTGGEIPRTSDSRVQFIVGDFQATLPSFLLRYRPRHPLVVHLDADLYTSTLYCLAKLDMLLASDSIVLFDEFGTAQEFRAFRDYSTSHRRKFRVVGVTLARDEPVFEQVALQPLCPPFQTTLPATPRATLGA